MSKQIVNFIKSILSNRNILISLVKDDFRSKYVNNLLGVFWAFIQPTFTIVIFWFVFEMGFRNGPINDTPFILWLISGMIPWFYISESLSITTNSIKDNAFLVKKIVFEVSLLPIVKLCSAFIVHAFFVAFMLVMFILYGYEPNLYWLQLFYYVFCATVMMLGVAWLTSSIVVFFNDLTQIISMVIQFGFWLTPIFWQLNMLPNSLQWIFKLNPIYYIVQGFRDSLIDNVWFWEKPAQILCFWLLTLTILILGSSVFKKLRPHFADVL
ncbi:ABC transporter permease [Aeromonas veronii]|uniref:ABC transporter permease n=1 Tax=Aeromonas sp. 55A TaxID=3452720 RepID=UPI003A224276